MLGSLFKSERRAIQATAWGEWPGDPQSPQTITTSSSLQLLTVYGCVSFICDGISTLPVDVFRDDNGKAVEVTKPRWLEEPVPGLDTIAWLTQFLSSMLLAGNSYNFLDYLEGGLNAVIPLDPMKVHVERVRGVKVFRVGGELFDARRILHTPAVMFPGADVGLSPVDAARRSIGLGMLAQQYGSDFFEKGSHLSGVIEDPGELDPQKAVQTAKTWAKLHSGPKNNHLPGVLQGGAVWKETSITNEQAQFLETRGFTAAEIAGQMFRTDPSELGIPIPQGGNLTYANLQERNRRKVQVTFLPWIVRVEHAVFTLLPRPRYMKFNVDALLRADLESRYKSYAVGIQNKFVYPNEARALEDMAPVPGGDDFPDIQAPKV